MNKINLVFENCEELNVEAESLNLVAKVTNSTDSPEIVCFSAVVPDMERFHKRDITQIEINNVLYMVAYEEEQPGHLGSENLNEKIYRTDDGRLIISICS